MAAPLTAGRGTGFQLSLALQGDLRAALAADEARMAGAMMLAAAVTADDGKAHWRAEIARAGLSAKLQNTIRSRVFPRRGQSIRPSVVVDTSAPKLMRGLTEATVIRAKSGGWLAIPTANAPARLYGKRVTPRAYEDRYGTGRLHFVAGRKPGTAVLIDRDVRASRGRAGGYAPRRANARGKGEAVVMFVLVREVRTRPRFSLPAQESRLAAVFARNVGRIVAAELDNEGSAARTASIRSQNAAAVRGARRSARAQRRAR